MEQLLIILNIENACTLASSRYMYDYVIFYKRSAPLFLHLPRGNDFLERRLNGRKVVEAEETTRNT